MPLMLDLHMPVVELFTPSCFYVNAPGLFCLWLLCTVDEYSAMASFADNLKMACVLRVLLQ